MAIGRALMTNPRLLLLDEVSLGLAPIVVDTLYESLGTILSGGTTVLLVEQDLGRALGVARRVLCMLEGRVVLDEPADDVTREQVVEAYFGLSRRNGGDCAGGAGMNWINAIVQGVMLGGVYALFACGLSLMFGVMRTVNLSHGDLAVLGAFLVAVWPPPSASARSSRSCSSCP